MSKDQSKYAGIALVVLLAPLAFSRAAFAHEKWFVEAEPYRTDWAQAFKFPQILGVAFAVAITVALGVV